MSVEIAGYEYRINGGDPQDVGAVVTTLVGTLLPDTTYGFEVRAYDSDGNRGPWTPLVSETTYPTIRDISLIAHASAPNVGGTALTGAINTTGASALYACVPYFTGDTIVVSDSKSNTWVPLSHYNVGNVFTQLWYCKNPTVGSGHTFQATGSTLASIVAAAFSGTDTAANFDNESGAGVANGGALTVQPGSITPAHDNDLVLTGFGYFDQPGARISTIDSGFTMIDTVLDAAKMCVGLAYKVQTTSTAVNPTWTGPVNSFGIATAMAAFKHSPVVVALEGDSRTASLGIDAMIQALLNSHYNVINIATSGDTLQNMVGTGQVASDAVPLFNVEAIQNIWHIDAGVNDFRAGRTLAQAKADTLTLYGQARAAGFKILACTVCPCTLAWITSGQLSDLLAYNTWLLTNPSGIWDVMADLASDASLSNPADTSIYADGLHWSSTGTGIAAGLINTAIRSIINV